MLGELLRHTEQLLLCLYVKRFGRESVHRRMYGTENITSTADAGGNKACTQASFWVQNAPKSKVLIF